MAKQFNLKSAYEPSGDQPQAISQLVAGLQAGEAYQTLLGVTGSGKSIGYNDPVLIVEETSGGSVPRLQPIGPLIDQLMESDGSSPSLAAQETSILESSDPPRYYTVAFDPSSGESGLHPIGAFLRHRAPHTMFRMVTACGREVSLTGDHNLWVLREGELHLLPTEEVRYGDSIPLPETLPGGEGGSEPLSPLEGTPHCGQAAGAALTDPAPQAHSLTPERLRHLGYSLAEGKERHLPPFWLALSNFELGVLLRAYFDHAGRIAARGAICATAASEALASDLGYALLRFGIWAQIRRPASPASSEEEHQLVVSGRRDLERFTESIGFDHPEKSQTLQMYLEHPLEYEEERIPIDGGELRSLRRGLGTTQGQLARQAGDSTQTLQQIEAGTLQPSRDSLQRLLDSLQRLASDQVFQELAWWRLWYKLAGLIKVRWTPVICCEPSAYPHPYVYDLAVPGPETFLAGQGGVFVHNTYTMAQVIQQLNRPALIMAPNKTLAAQLYAEMRGFFPENRVEYFVSYYDYYQPEAYVPSSDTYIEKDASINEQIEQMRLSATKSLLERNDAIIVASVSAIYGLGDPAAYHGMILHLRQGDRADRQEILRKLTEIQYTRNELELRRGTFRVRGDLVEVFPAENEAEAVRIELFDDEVDGLSTFDPLTGEVTQRLPRITVYPKTHYVTSRHTLLEAIEQIKVELKERLQELRAANRELEAQRLEQRTRFDIEMMQELGYCSGIENYSRYLSGRNPGEPPPTLMEYLPNNALLILDESHVTVPQIGGMYNGDRSRKQTLVDYGFRLPSALDNRPLKFEEFERLMPQTVFVSATPGPYEEQRSGAVVEQIVRPTGLVDPRVEILPATSQVDHLLSEIHKRIEAEERVLVTTLTKRMAEDLTSYLAEVGIRVRYMHSDVDTVERSEIIRDLRLGKFDVLIGINLLREGLDLPEVSLVAILDADKEGFLRSERSLIQTIGRAARNIHGTALLFADTITGSIHRAVGETERRRAKQQAYNEAHGITPETIRKAVTDILDGIPERGGYRGPAKRPKVAEPASSYEARDSETLSREITRLEEEMFTKARNLEFEEAARLRDQIQGLKSQLLELEKSP